MDAVSLINDAYRAGRLMPYAHKNTAAVRETVLSLDSETAGKRKKQVFEDLKARSKDIQVLHQVFQTMDLSSDQAESLITVLCTDKNLKDCTRKQLIQCYQDYALMKPFYEGNNFSVLNGAQDVFDSTRAHNCLQFIMAVMQALPVDSSPEKVEQAMAEALERIESGKIRSQLLMATGLVGPESSMNRNFNGSTVKKESPSKTSEPHISLHNISYVLDDDDNHTAAAGAGAADDNDTIDSYELPVCITEDEVVPTKTRTHPGHQQKKKGHRRHKSIRFGGKEIIAVSSH